MTGDKQEVSIATHLEPKIFRVYSHFNDISNIRGTICCKISPVLHLFFLEAIWHKNPSKFQTANYTTFPVTIYIHNPSVYQPYTLRPLKEIVQSQFQECLRHACHEILTEGVLE